MRQPEDSYAHIINEIHHGSRGAFALRAERVLVEWSGGGRGSDTDSDAIELGFAISNHECDAHVYTDCGPDGESLGERWLHADAGSFDPNSGPDRRKKYGR